MFDFTAALVEITNFINTGMSVIDPTTAVGGLVMAGFGVGIVFGVLRRIKSVIPR